MAKTTAKPELIPCAMSIAVGSNFGPSVKKPSGSSMLNSARRAVPGGDGADLLAIRSHPQLQRRRMPRVREMRHERRLDWCE